MAKAHVVSHTHWDREWYRPFQYFKVRLTYFMDDVLNTLEQQDNYKYFMLDGQTVMIEDYLTVKPENRNRITTLVNEGKLIVGPWYSQPDEFVPSGESLVRNLLIGIRQSQDFGAYMNIGYLPDAFGQSAQMPQILKGFGIDSACMMRGVPVHKLNQSDFIWKGLNGDEVIASALATGYSNGMFMPDGTELIEMRLKKAIKDLNKLGGQEDFLILNGVDHQLVQPAIANFIEDRDQNDTEVTFEHTTLQHYFDDISQNTEDFVTVEGELISPVTNRVHTSIASSRIYQKIANREMEQLLVHKVEPLAAIAYAFGAEYPKANINDAWKSMFQNQAHDSICGCCTDEIHREIDQRFTDVRNIGTTLYNMYSRSMARNLTGEAPVLVLWNTSFIKGHQLVRGTVYTESCDFTLKDKNQQIVPFTVLNSEVIDAAALSLWTLYLEKETPVHKTDIQLYMDFDFNIGYKVLDIVDGSIAVEPLPTEDQSSLMVTDRTVESEHLKIMVNDNGTFNMIDKVTGITYKGLNEIEDCGCAGDTYNYSPVSEDMVILSNHAKDHTSTITKYDGYTVIQTDYTMMIPEQLIDHDQRRSVQLIPLPISSRVTLFADEKRIDIETTLNNNAKDHRIRVLFPTPIISDCSYAETQFGTICRTNSIDEAALWEERKWSEKPLPIYSQQRFTSVNDGNHGLAVLNKGLSEYEIYENDGSTIAITLLRGVGMMGKGNLAIRPGRPSGIPIPTPEAQCQGKHTYQYSLYPHAGNIDTGEVTREAIQYESEGTFTQSHLPMKSLTDYHQEFFELYNIPHMNDFVQRQLNDLNQEQCELINLSDPRIIISCLKKAEDEEALILRIYNSTSEAIKGTNLAIGLPVDDIQFCDFAEKPIESLTVTNNQCSLQTINGYTAYTYQIIFTNMGTNLNAIRQIP